MNRRQILTFPTALALPVLGQPASTESSVLDSHQAATLDILAETMVPGSRQAGVPKYIELFLRDGSPADRERFLDGLAWLDGYSLRTLKGPFVKASSADQLKMLETLESSEGEDLAPGRRFVARSKSMVGRIYFSTRDGFNELNKGGRVPSSFGCGHANKEHA